tara:strand:- start:136 stop:1095 length:960 start_codon:yes stop_codon:yes gene_type:complete
VKTIGLLGSGRVALEYAKVIKKLGYKVDFASSSSQNSKSWKKFKKENPDVKYLKTDSIINNKKINYIFSLLPHLKQIDYFPRLLISEKNICFEKPFFNDSKKFEKLILKNKNNLQNKYFSFNRRFYEVVNILKKRLKKKNTIKLIRVNISENFSQKTINKSSRFKKNFPYFGSSSHILDLLFYFFKNIRYEKNYAQLNNNFYPSRYVILKCEKQTPIFLFIEKNAPLKNGIEVIFNDDTIWSLTPIERIRVYKGYKIKNLREKNKNYLNYEQKIIYEKQEKSYFKPGLKQTIQCFLNKKDYKTDFKQYLNYLKLYEKIF